MSNEKTSQVRARDAALQDLAASAVANIPGVDFASITVRRGEDRLQTAASTDPLAQQLDWLQYELREGPCYAAVTVDRLVIISDVATSPEFPRYGPRAAELGVGSQVAIQLISDGEQAGLNLYALHSTALDSSVVQLAELFATQAAAVLEYAEQVEQLNEALHTRTDIGTAVGIVMQRYGLDRNRAFDFLVRKSNTSNVKLRVLAREIIVNFQGSQTTQGQRSAADRLEKPPRT